MPDRKIEFKENVNGLTKIYVGGTEMDTRLEPSAMKTYRLNKKKLPPIMGQQILDTITKKLRDDKVNLSSTEMATIVSYAKEQLGMD